MAEYPALPIAFPYAIKPPNYKTLRTEMEQGYIQTRAKVTRAPRRWEFQHKQLTIAEKDAWLAIWNSHKGGSGVFTFRDPDSGVDVSVRFAMSDPNVVLVSPRRYDIAVELEEVL